METWEKISKGLNSGKIIDSWSKFCAKSREDTSFFLTYGPEFAKFLEKKGKTDLSISILRTYCQLRPAASSEQRTLDELIKHFAGNEN